VIGANTTNIAMKNLNVGSFNISSTCATFFLVSEMTFLSRKAITNHENIRKYESSQYSFAYTFAPLENSFLLP
jgi:hypothetical protein